jgi:hypothetical protein
MEDDAKTFDGQEKSAPSFKVLLERFEAKTKAIPTECYDALFFYLRARHIQKHRIALENALRQTEKLTKQVFWAGNIPEQIKRALLGEERFLLEGLPTEKTKGRKHVESIYSMENRMIRESEKAFEQTRWYREVAKAAAEGEGMGPMIAGALLWCIGDAKRFATFGKIVRYAGLDVVNGKAPKRKRGSKITWNPELRKTLYKLTEVWNKRPDGIWRARWEGYKAWYAETRPEIFAEVSKKEVPCGKGHIHNMARRKVQREFLRNLYWLWLEYE